YNHFALHLSRMLVQNNLADGAKVYIVSQIGKPINEPQLLHIVLVNRRTENKHIEELAQNAIGDIASFSKMHLSKLKN
ncbi:MAG: hypothetical protein OEW04_14245, partial [Nitrospirota bacterium]|nr:hypothetical protein [Nitrospirota bacterium]